MKTGKFEVRSELIIAVLVVSELVWMLRKWGMKEILIPSYFFSLFVSELVWLLRKWEGKS